RLVFDGRLRSRFGRRFGLRRRFGFSRWLVVLHQPGLRGRRRFNACLSLGYWICNEVAIGRGDAKLRIEGAFDEAFQLDQPCPGGAAFDEREKSRKRVGSLCEGPYRFWV